MAASLRASLRHSFPNGSRLPADVARGLMVYDISARTRSTISTTYPSGSGPPVRRMMWPHGLVQDIKHSMCQPTHDTYTSLYTFSHTPAGADFAPREQWAPLHALPPIQKRLRRETKCVVWCWHRPSLRSAAIELGKSVYEESRRYGSDMNHEEYV